MKTQLSIKIIYAITFLAISCHTDDVPPPKQQAPVQQPDSKPEPESEAEPEPENLPPGPFVLLTPEMDSKVIARTPNLTWEQSTDPDGDSVFYDVYLDTEENPSTLIAGNLNSTTFSVPEDLDLKTEYHWKVVARDGNGAILKSMDEMSESESELSWSY